MSILLDGSLEEVMSRYVTERIGGDGYQSVTVTAVDCDRLYTYLAAYLKAVPGATVFEFAAGHGITTCIVLKAIHDFGRTAKLITSELRPGLHEPLLSALPNEMFSLIRGDLRKHLEEVPDRIDFLIIDADHTSECAEWYVEALMSRVAGGGMCFLHDMSLRPNHWRETLTVMGNLQMLCFQVLHHPDENIASIGWEMRNPASFTSGMVLRRQDGPVVPAEAQ